MESNCRFHRCTHFIRNLRSILFALFNQATISIVITVKATESSLCMGNSAYIKLSAYAIRRHRIRHIQVSRIR